MAADSRGRFRDALRQRDLRLLIIAFLVDQVGGWSYNVVLVVYVYERTGSPAWIAATTAAGWVPRILCSTYAGVLADRYERTRVLLVSALLAGAVMIGLTLVVAVRGPVLLTLGLSALAAAFGTTYRPASSALIPEIVAEKELTAANALLGGLENLVVVLGPAIGGLLLLTGDATWGVGVNAASFLVAAVLVARLRVHSRGSAGQAGESLLAQIGAGASALRSQPTALLLVGFCALDTAVYGASTVLYVPISEHLGTGSTGYSYLLAGAALGGVLVAAAVNRISAAARLAPVIVGGMLLLALPFAVTALTGSPALGFGLQVVSGAGMVVVDVLAVTALQRDLPRELLSRVFGIFETIVPAAALAASFAVAAILRVTTLTLTLVIVGVGFSVISLCGLRPLLRADRATAGLVRRLSSRVAALTGLELFAAANRPVLERLAASVEVQELPADEIVVREGDRADALFVLVAGEVGVTARGEGTHPRQLRNLGPGSYFGEIGLLHALPRTATVTTIEPVTLWRIPADDFFAALQSATLSSSMLSRSATWLAASHPRLATTASIVGAPEHL